LSKVQEDEEYYNQEDSLSYGKESGSSCEDSVDEDKRPEFLKKDS
jgi:hypothetical protein